MIDKLYYMVSVVIFYNVINVLLTLLFLNNKDNIDNNKNALDIKTNGTIADRFLLVCFGICFIAFFVVSARNNMITFLLVYCYLFYFINAIKSADDLNQVIVNNEKRELSYKEKKQFLLLASCLSSIYGYFSEKKIVSFVDKFSISFLGKEIILTLYILFFAFCFTCIFLVELVTPIKHLKKLYDNINPKLLKRSMQFSEYFSNLLEEPVVKARSTNKLICLLKGKKAIVQIISIIPLLITFITDFFSNILIMGYVIVMDVAIRSILYILSVLLKILFNTLFSLLKNPSQTVMYFTFRLSVIFSVFLVVIYNRMNILFVPDDSFLAISEFIASTVVIPIILEWIYSNKHIK